MVRWLASHHRRRAGGQCGPGAAANDRTGSQVQIVDGSAALAMDIGSVGNVFAIVRAGCLVQVLHDWA
jgi:hypothetical protein